VDEERLKTLFSKPQVPIKIKIQRTEKSYVTEWTRRS
jgi:hypothetical protein